MRDLMFAAVWIVALPLSVVSPHAGVMLWVWVAMLSPNELLYGFMAGVPFNKLIVATTVPFIFLSKEKKDFYLDPILTLLLAFGLIGVFSWTFSIVSSDDGTELFFKLLKIIVLTFVITGVASTRMRMHQLVIAIVISLGFLGVKEGLISILTAGGHQIIGNGGIGDNNSLATALLMVVPLTYYLARYSEVKMMRLAMFAVMGLSIVTTVMTFSRGGFIGLIVVGALMIKNSRSKFLSLILVVVAAALIFSFAPASWFERLNTIEDANNDSSFMGRVVAWKISLLIALDHPLFGGGFHAVQRGLTWSAYRPFLPSVNFVNTPPADVLPHAAHSIYFEVLGDFGFLGLAVYLSMLGMTLLRCRQIIKMARRVPSLQWAADLGRMMEISLMVFFVTAAALSMAYFELFYVFLAIISRCHRTVRQMLAEGIAEQPAPAAMAPRGGFVPGPLARPPVAARLQPGTRP